MYVFFGLSSHVRVRQRECAKSGSEPRIVQKSHPRLISLILFTRNNPNVANADFFIAGMGTMRALTIFERFVPNAENLIGRRIFNDCGVEAKEVSVEVYYLVSPCRLHLFRGPAAGRVVLMDAFVHKLAVSENLSGLSAFEPSHLLNPGCCKGIWI